MKQNMNVYVANVHKNYAPDFFTSVSVIITYTSLQHTKSTNLVEVPFVFGFSARTLPIRFYFSSAEISMYIEG